VERSFRGRFDGVKRLRVDDIGLFDGTNQTPTATAYCRRLDILANMYGEDPVLAALPLCIKGLAAAWFNSIEPDVVDIMMASVDNFNAQLLQ
jgi:hypothetical protein